MNKTTISKQIDSILQKRQPNIAKITQSQQSVKSLLDGFKEMELLKTTFLRNEENSEIWQQLDFISISKKLETAQLDLERLKERFSRNTLRIGVAGQARQGKSQLLQSLTGLSAKEIPTSSGGFTTGARSLIYHHDSVETYAKVYFYSEQDFMNEIIAPYFKKLKKIPDLILREAPENIEQFSNFILPTLEEDSNSTGGLTVALLNQLREYKKNLNDYHMLLGCNEKRISSEEILRYVSQHNPDGDEKYQFYRAVRLVEIYTRFPLAEVSSIALADLPGLDEIKEGESERLIKSLAQDVDMVLFVKLPPDTGDAWKQQDMALYKLAQDALIPIDLAKCSFMVLNRHSDGKRDKLCQKMKNETRQHGIYTSDVVVASCIDSIESQEKILLPVLDYMAKNIQAIDDDYLNAKRAELTTLRNEAQQALQQVSDVLKLAGIGKGQEKTFSEIFKNFEASENALANYVNVLKQHRNEADDDLKEALNVALKNAQESNCGIPSIEQLKEESIQEQAWGIVFGHKMHFMRNELTRHFQTLDDSLRESVEDMKHEIVMILRNGGLARFAPECEDSHFLKVVFEQLDKDEFPELHQGFYYLIDFQLSFRNLFQYRLRESLTELYADDTTFGLPSQKLTDLSAEHVQGLLQNALEKTFYEVENVLAPLLKEPNMARYAIAEEFRDRIWKASDAKEQWRIFLGERKNILWPEKFKWAELLTDVNKKLSHLTLA
jgi:hypothetical protein